MLSFNRRDYSTKRIVSVGGVSKSGRILELYRDENSTQHFFQISCKEKGKRCGRHPVLKALSQRFQCVQKYSFTYALVREFNAPELRYRIPDVSVILTDEDARVVEMLYFTRASIPNGSQNIRDKYSLLNRRLMQTRETSCYNQIINQSSITTIKQLMDLLEDIITNFTSIGVFVGMCCHLKSFISVVQMRQIDVKRDILSKEFKVIEIPIESLN
ncbi:unnamed protein product [Oppiella nova]|uniref:Uncharacterized protein n=1 Tax=Oppiella nova TaxID=334625 RepID=A0A7R9LGN5_9ACAR|nr:unnamed protein product [Oppiella nova]CAG2163497.1 unnamed protein product [Oppiella nova]